MKRALVLAGLAGFAGCAAPEPAASPEPRMMIVAPIAPPVVREAARTRAEARRYVDHRPYLSSAELIRMFELSQDMERAVRRLRAHRSAANERAVKDAIDAMRVFMSRHEQ